MAARTLGAALLLCALLAALLGAWFVSGWHDVKLQQAQVRQAPVSEASERGLQIAMELRLELDGLLAREVRRPYFHYQNLMHDPRSSAVGVTPSPLAKSPDDPLVLGFFQIDAKGQASTPTINDEVPDLSDPDRLAANREFRDRVGRDLAHELTPPANATVLVAEANEGEAPIRAPRHPVPAEPKQVETQQVQYDMNTYSQNASSNRVWQQQEANNVDATVEGLPAGNATPTPPEPKPQPKPQPRPAPKPQPKPPRQVTITVTPLEWRTLAFNGKPALVAVRQVLTPDGNLSQGFVVDRATLEHWLGVHARGLSAQLLATSPKAAASPAGTFASATPEIAPGWQLIVQAEESSISTALGRAADIASTFVLRFVFVGVVAVFTALVILALVSRAEKLARERSQFAAAAAHELRTPLAGLQLYGDMLADGLGDRAKLEDYARRMSEEAARLGRVVSNVLGFSQLERGNLSVSAQTGSLGDALRELAERVQPTLDRAGAVLDLDVAPDLKARFDRDALARIVGNLIDNAEKYARDAEDRTIHLTARDRGDVVEIAVADHGPGIAAPERLFKPFARGVAADGPAGLGLGLALSRSLAHVMGGDLAYRNAATGGAELVLTLPRA